METSRVTASILPPALWQQIAAFLDAGNTGKVEIAVRRGKITGFVVAASYQMDECEAAPRIVDIVDERRHRVSSRK